MQLPFSQACENNKDPILHILKVAFANASSVLEVGSGTGQHAVYFAEALPHLKWQASDQEPYLPGIEARIKKEGVENQPLPLEFDVFKTVPKGQFDGLFTANTCHIMPEEGVEALFNHLGKNLKLVKYLCIYGPFNDNGHFTSDSNRAFNQSLQARDEQMGIRDKQWITELAGQQGFELKNAHAMPANNQLLEFQR
ncbi:MAG: class I SAM-dependent methyltransferase [Idiomarina sp.]|nr:class I SAM-dependent methyltransferase [Idiomarina sp.]